MMVKLWYMKNDVKFSLKAAWILIFLSFSFYSLKQSGFKAAADDSQLILDLVRCVTVLFLQHTSFLLLWCSIFGIYFFLPRMHLWRGSTISWTFVAHMRRLCYMQYSRTLHWICFAHCTVITRNIISLREKCNSKD